MKLVTLEKNDIDNLNFDKTFDNIFENEDKIEYFSSNGKEHYRLLSYFSTLFNNSNIIDIGSQKGYSSLALSYNKTNTVYSFDIVDNVRNNIKSVNNIHFFMIIYLIVVVEKNGKILFYQLQLFFWM